MHANHELKIVKLAGLTEPSEIAYIYDIGFCHSLPSLLLQRWQ